jgi:acetyl esterase
MNVHKNARLTPSGRALLANRVAAGWTVKAAALAAGVSLRTAHKWLSRHRLGGERRHHDRSSAPRRCPRRTSPHRLAEIEALRRRQRMSGLDPRFPMATLRKRSLLGAPVSCATLGTSCRWSDSTVTVARSAAVSWRRLYWRPAMPLDPACEAMLATAFPPDRSIPEFRALEPKHIEALRPFAQPVAGVEDRTILGSGVDVPIRIYSPFAARGSPLLVLIHGGGWVVGSIETHDVMARDLCVALGAVVVSVDYRRAPEHPYPAAVDDCWAALTWAAGAAEALGAEPGRVAVVGDSAGANLAAAMAVRARDAGGPVLAAQLLVHPVLDLVAPYHPDPSSLYPSRRSMADGYGATSAQLERYARMYAPDPNARSDPLVSPMHAADGPGLAPAIILVAEYDPLHDEGVAYAAKLSANGTPVILKDYAGAIHGAFGPALSAGLPQRAFAETMADLMPLLRLGVVRGTFR